VGFTLHCWADSMIAPDKEREMGRPYSLEKSRRSNTGADMTPSSGSKTEDRITTQPQCYPVSPDQ
jgi:hypothetical protein